MNGKFRNFVIVAFLVLLCCGLVFAVASHYNLDEVIVFNINEPIVIETEEELNMTFLGECFTPSRASIVCYHDDDRNVTCYIFRGSQKGGISCIPDKDL